MGMTEINGQRTTFRPRSFYNGDDQALLSEESSDLNPDNPTQLSFYRDLTTAVATELIGDNQGGWVGLPEVQASNYETVSTNYRIGAIKSYNGEAERIGEDGNISKLPKGLIVFVNTEIINRGQKIKPTRFSHYAHEVPGRNGEEPNKWRGLMETYDWMDVRTTNPETGKQEVIRLYGKDTAALLGLLHCWQGHGFADMVIEGKLVRNSDLKGNDEQKAAQIMEAEPMQSEWGECEPINREEVSKAKAAKQPV